MIAATEHEGRAGRLLGDGVCSVAAYVVECADNTVLAQDDQDGKVGNLERDVVASFGETAAVSDADPGLGVLELIMRKEGTSTLLKTARRSRANKWSEVHQPSVRSGSLETSTGEMDDVDSMGTSAKGAIMYS